MINEAQITIRNAGFLLTQRGLHILFSLLFAVLVPRLMGPNNYGRYALITSLAFWFMILSDLGFSQIMGRYVPLFRLKGEKEKLQKFFSNLLAVSLISGVLSGCLFLSLTAFWLSDLELLLLVAMAATIIVRSATHPFFTLFLGLNQAARWGMGDIFRHGFVIVLVLIGFYMGGLQGACLGFLFTEFVVLSIGMFWGKFYFSWKDLRLDLKYLIPYLRFGFMFFAFNLLTSAFQHSGEVLVRFFYPDYVQVAYFGLAYHVYITISIVIPQMTFAFIPFMMTLQGQGETNVLKRWIEQLINWLTVGGVLAFFGVLLLGNDLVPLILGARYQPVATNLLPLFMMLWLLVLSSVAILLTVVYDRPKIALMAAGIRLVGMWVFGPFLIAKWGSWGGCLAVLAASVVYTGYFTWRMQEIVTYSLQKWGLTIVLGLPFLLLLVWQSNRLVNGLLYGIFVIGYGGLLFFLRIVTLKELKAVWQAIDPRRRISDLKV
jgi:O-antigen/teichoic acid export membrane protein